MKQLFFKVKNRQENTIEHAKFIVRRWQLLRYKLAISLGRGK
jgi:hypothetical protein